MNFDPLLRRGSSFPPNFLGQKAPKKVKISTLNLHLFFRYFSYCRAKGSSAAFVVPMNLESQNSDPWLPPFFPTTHSLFKSRRMLEAKGEKGSQVTWAKYSKIYNKSDQDQVLIKISKNQIGSSYILCKAFFSIHYVLY